MPQAAHILLIDDDTSLAANLCDVLKEDGFKVTVCNRGDEGLRRANHDECDVALTDLRLPGLGGLELVKQLHETQPRLPVVLMTAHGTIETAIEATKLGAYDYLQKPFEMQGLICVLHRAAEAGTVRDCRGDTRGGRNSLRPPKRLEQWTGGRAASRHLWRGRQQGRSPP